MCIFLFTPNFLLLSYGKCDLLQLWLESAHAASHVNVRLKPIATCHKSNDFVDEDQWNEKSN